MAESLRQGFQQGEKQGFQQGFQQGEQRMLVRQLHRKFTRVPKGIVQHIETTADLEQLDDWLDQVISAKKLAEIDFNLPQKT